MDKRLRDIKDLLDSINNRVEEKKAEIANAKDMWRRIGNKDSFDDLGLSPNELQSFLTQWMEENPYNNI